jgi:hypothetical protein
MEWKRVWKVGVGIALLMGGIASGVELKDKTFYLGITGDYIKNHTWGAGEVSHYSGGGAKGGYYFIIPNAYGLGNRATLGISIFNKYSRLSPSPQKYPTKISDYFADLDWIYPVNAFFHPFFGVSYHYISFDMRGDKEVGWHGPGLRLGSLFYLWEHLELEIGGEYIWLGNKTDSNYPAETPTWKGSASLNFSF